MKKKYPLLLLLFLPHLIVAQSSQKINLTFFGSSVCKGAGAENDHGYAWQFYHSQVIDTTKYQYANVSTGGDNTLKIEKHDRLTNKLYPADPDIVIIGLSLANEGIRRATDDHGRERILEQFRGRLLGLADSLQRAGSRPVIVNCYAHSLFTDGHYEFTKKMNRMINTWSYPSINVLGTIDDLSGKWVEGYVKDPGHPNTKGHEEMSYAIVPSLFDAMEIGKKIPVYDWNPSYCTLINDKKNDKPLILPIEHAMHSFTINFKFKKAKKGTIAGFEVNEKMHNISVDGWHLKYKDLVAIYDDNEWTLVTLSHSYVNQYTSLFINGEFVGKTGEQLSPSLVYFGGRSSQIDLKDLSVHRSALNSSEAMDLFHNHFIQSSLEFYQPLTSLPSGETVANNAQSLTELKIAKDVSLTVNQIDL